LVRTLQVSAQYTFSGIVTDTGQETLPGVQVLLFVSDSLYAGALTDNAGNFSLRNLQAADYLLRILYPGFTPIEENRQIKGNQHFQFTLEKEMTADLAEVEVIGNRSDVIKRTATGQIFHLSEKARNSGDPYQALREIPRLVVNEALRKIAMEDGSSPLILINGMTVNSGVTPIDPRDIESVEVMDVVNARYLRTGTKHIINIKLKEKRTPYRFFEAMTRHDIPWRQGMGAVYFEVGNSKYSLYGRGAANYIYDDDTETTSWQQDIDYYKQSSGTAQADSHNFLGELLFKWMFTKKDYLAAHAYGRYDKNKTSSDGDGLYQTNDIQTFDYATLNKNNSYVWTGSLYHKHTFSDDELLENTFAYNYNRNYDEGVRSETYPNWLYRYLYEYRNKRSSGRWNMDYSRNWNDVNSLNIGSEIKFVNDHIHQVSENYPVFFHREWNGYLYAAFSSKIKNFYYMGSAGIESIWLKAGDASGKYIKPRMAISGTYEFNDNHSFQAGYTLTNEAPTVGQLNPYNTSTDSLVIIRGNPNLFPMQVHDLNASYTFNKTGLYITPYTSYQIYTDVIEPFGYNENGIYVSSYHNNGKFRTLTTGGSVSYRLGNWGRIYGSSYYYVDYFSEQDPHKSFSYSLGGTARYKKWTINVDYNYRNYAYTAISRTKYHTPDFSSAQIQYNFTPNFYISVAVQYFTGVVLWDVETYGDNYQSFTSQRMLDKNVRPWILIRYTFRKNDKQKIKLNNVVTGKEQGISILPFRP
jgi:hypothetical protein